MEKLSYLISAISFPTTEHGELLGPIPTDLFFIILILRFVVCKFGFIIEYFWIIYKLRQFHKSSFLKFTFKDIRANCSYIKWLSNDIHFYVNLKTSSLCFEDICFCSMLNLEQLSGACVTWIVNMIEILCSFWSFVVIIH